MTCQKWPSRVQTMAGQSKARPRRYALFGTTIEPAKAAPGLYLVATPIGNLADVTLRALELLAGADVIACEDTRVTRRLVERYCITTPLTPYHEHNAAEARPRLLARLADGQAIALVSDAGTPLISDPGYKLARAACEAGHMVTTLPGASAVLAALSIAGLPTDRFFFEGFLRQALTRVSLKDAVGEVALATGCPRREVYQRALVLARDTADDRE